MSDDERGSRTQLVLVAHGSRATTANDAHRAVAARLAERLGATVRSAFLELAEPSIGDAIDDAVAAGAPQVVVLPHFLYPGRHVGEDIPAIVAEAADRHPGATIELARPSGDDPAMVELLVELARRALDG
ncbi:MAG: CbiX/SirB N-terminal domain-containing protein [Acidimicrobiales bacterium]